MIPPYELKDKEFQTVFKGYSKTEVDEYLAFVIEKYTELYRAQDALTRKLAVIESELDAYRGKEDAIRRVLVDSQSAAKRLTDDAEKRAALMIESTTETCERILAEFREQIKVEINTLKALRKQVLDFKNKMFIQYQKHIELIQNITPGDLNESDFALSPSEYAARALAKAKSDVRGGKTRKEIEEERALSSAVKLTVQDVIKNMGADPSKKQ